MKTATIPALRVDPKLRLAAQNSLYENETLSSFMLQSLSSGIKHRELKKEFYNRGMISRQEAKDTGEYFSSQDVLSDLEQMLASKKV
jgi:hypothetical protein